MDYIKLTNIRVQTLIGTRPEERNHKQELILAMTLGTDFSQPAQTDDLEYAIDYVDILQKTIDLCENSQFFLLETLLEKLASQFLNISGVEMVRISVDKPAAMYPVMTTLEIQREKKH